MLAVTQPPREPPSIVVHGGAGLHPASTAGAARLACAEAAEVGREMLLRGGSALDAVEAAVRVLEDAPELNAGRGSVLNADGRVEVDASVMRGRDLAAGAVGAVPGLLHPVTLARRVLEDGRYVLLVGEGALRFARAHGITPEGPEALVVPRQVRRYVAELARLRALEKGVAISAEHEHAGDDVEAEPLQRSGGTVGAVARDVLGHLAAATSTGGLSFKLAGRVGDTPIPGAGTYADDAAAAASATGAGENIMRVLLTKHVVDALRPHEDGRDVAHPDEAARESLQMMLLRTGGTAGLIVIDRSGRIGVWRSTEMMPHARSERGAPVTSGL